MALEGRGASQRLAAKRRKSPRHDQSRRKTPRRAASPPVAPVPSKHTPPEAERRQLTVQFCDLVGSTALSARAGSRRLSSSCPGAISKRAPRSSSDMRATWRSIWDDGLLVYFGYPTAHEDDARRAVRTGAGDY